MPKQINDDEVYLAAVQVLVEQGYAGATTKRIAEQAGINEVTLFRKYGSKAELILQAVEKHTFNPTEDDIYYTGDVVEDLLRFVTSYERSAEHSNQLFPLMVIEMSRHPELKEILVQILASIKVITDLIQRYQDEGVLHPEPPIHTLSALLGAVTLNKLLQTAMPELNQIPAIDLRDHIQQFLNGRMLTDSTIDG